MRYFCRIATTLATLCVVSLCLPARAVPAWWDDYQYRESGGGEITRPVVTDPASGNLDIPMRNYAVPNVTKRLYFILDWQASDWNVVPPSSTEMTSPVWFSYPPYYGTIFTGGTEEVNVYDAATGWHHWEYSFSITPQPAKELARVHWIIGVPGVSLRYKYDFRSRCPDAGATMGLLGLSVLGLCGGRRLSRK